MADAQQPNQEPSCPRISLRRRLKAWWDGYDLEIKGAAVETPEPSALNGEPQICWDEIRIQLSQRIWGEGFSSPAQEDFVLGILRTAGLTPAMTVLELGSGLGGAGRLLAKSFGCWVTCLEADPILVAAGNDTSIRLGLGKKAPVEPFDPESVDLKESTYDCVFSLGFLFGVMAKERLLQQVDGALKDRGQLLVTDFVKADGVEESAEVKNWLDFEPAQRNLWSAAEYSGYLESLGYDVRVVADISEDFKAMVLRGWSAYLASLERTGLDQATAAALVGEVELWTRRTQALESGDLKYFRIHALKAS